MLARDPAMLFVACEARMVDSGDDWIGLAEIGELLRVRDRRTIKRLIAAENLPTVKVGRQVLSRRAWLNEWLRRRAAQQAGERVERQVELPGDE